MQKYKYITLLFVVLFLVGCAKDDVVTIGNLRAEKAVYGFGVGGGTTRTFINDDGVTISWDKDDKVALWAKKDNTFVLNNQEFKNWFITADKSQAFFTAELASQMAMGEYQYYVTYPKPASVSGTTATFNLPSTQDGKMGDGADIMVGEGEGPALAKLYIPKPEEGEKSVEEPDYVLDQNRLELKMRHLIHALRFYVPQTKWGFSDGETIERIVFTMPQAVAGTFVADVSANQPALSKPTGTSTSITLNLSKNMVASTGDMSDYAVASIAPPSTTYGDGQVMKVIAYTQKRFVSQEISLSGRGPGATNEKMKMAAGSVTPVGLDCSNPSNPKISFRIKSNNLGEDLYRITLESANPYAKWNENSTYVYVYDTGSENSTISKGDGFDIYSDFESISTIWGNDVKVTYDSASARVTQIITLPKMELKTNYTVDLDVPYLFAENFDGKTSNTDYWNYTYGSAGVSAWFPDYLKGWSGNQWRTDGNNIGVYSYTGNYTNASIFSSYTNFHYGRIDSPILPLKKDAKNVKLKIYFDVVSMTTEASNGSPSLIYGYSNNTEPLSGGYIETGSSENKVLNQRKLPTKQVGQEITSNGQVSSGSFEVSNPENLRITWFVNIKHKGSGSISNRKFYVYIDDILVQIDNGQK